MKLLQYFYLRLGNIIGILSNRDWGEAMAFRTLNILLMLNIGSFYLLLELNNKFILTICGLVIFIPSFFIASKWTYKRPLLVINRLFDILLYTYCIVTIIGFSVIFVWKVL